MSSEYFTRNECRLCQSIDLYKAFSLTATPPANAFVAHEHLNHAQYCFPLDLYQCQQCSHVQLTTVVKPESLFRNYVYVSGTSPVFRKHFAEYAQQIITQYKLSSDDLVIDIGSNDGSLLKCFDCKGISVLGIDPAVAIAEKASSEGIETWPEFFSKALADKIIEKKGRVKVACANNVFAHTDHLVEFVEAIRHLLTEDGIFVFEVSYLLDMVEGTLFDMIYHEHVSYHSIKPLQRFFSRLGMELFHISSVATHGGSIRCFVQKQHGPYEKNDSVNQMIDNENKLAVNKPQFLENFKTDVEQKKQALKELLLSLHASGKTIAGYGAPAKTTTLMYHFGIDRNLISYIIDDNPLKQDLYTPGLHIPVKDKAYLYENQPDYLLILAWNFASSIIKNNQDYKNAGGKFIVPLPTLTVE